MVSTEEEFRGLSLALYNRHFGEMRGLSIGLFNSADELRGFQIGVLNRAGGRWLPIANADF